MRTTVPLDQAGQLIEGRHGNPFELLGPHEVSDGDRRALAVRAFLPHSTQAWVVDPGHGDLMHPMRRIHPAGLYEAICPVSLVNGSRYKLRVADPSGAERNYARPLQLPAVVDRLRSLPAERGEALAVATNGWGPTCGRSTASRG